MARGGCTPHADSAYPRSAGQRQRLPQEGRTRLDLAHALPAPRRHGIQKAHRPGLDRSSIHMAEPSRAGPSDRNCRHRSCRTSMKSSMPPMSPRRTLRPKNALLPSSGPTANSSSNSSENDRLSSSSRDTRKGYRRFSRGCDDYVVKPFLYDELGRQVLPGDPGVEHEQDPGQRLAIGAVALARSSA
jgi:hypothetical protein